MQFFARVLKILIDSCWLFIINVLYIRNATQLAWIIDTDLKTSWIANFFPTITVSTQNWNVSIVKEGLCIDTCLVRVCELFT